MMFAGWQLRLTRPTKAVPVGPVSEAPPGFFYRLAVNSAIRTITCTAFSIPSSVTNSCLPW